MSIFRWTAPLFKWWGRRWTEEDFTSLARRLRPYVPSGGVIADLGGGTGELGAGLAWELDALAVIVDPTPQMLRRVDPKPWVSVRLASAEALPFPDDYFDALVICDAFHHFRNQDAAVREIARVVRHGGGVMILDMFPTGRERIWVWVEHLVGEPGRFIAPEPLEEFLRARGIGGTSRREAGYSYTFVGSVAA